MPKSPRSTLLLSLALVAVVSIVLEPGLAHASPTSGGGGFLGFGGSSAMPWDGPLQKIGAALTGGVAYWLALIGIFVSGAALVFGGEINEFVRRLIMLILLGSVMIGASSIMSGIMGKSAVIL